jgi:hypothetical protein
MATEWYYYCRKGEPKPKCKTVEKLTKSRCGKDSELGLTFPFGLGAGKWSYKVLDVFLPDPLPQPWKNDLGK